MECTGLNAAGYSANSTIRTGGPPVPSMWLG